MKLTTIAGGVALAAALTGCSAHASVGKSISSSALEKVGATTLAKQTGASADQISLSCPHDLEMKKGKSVTCDMVAKGATYDAVITYKGGSADSNVSIDATETGLTAATVEAELKRRAASAGVILTKATCDGPLPAKTGATQTCAFTTDAGEDDHLIVTSTGIDAQGLVGFTTGKTTGAPISESTGSAADAVRVSEYPDSGDSISAGALKRSLERNLAATLGSSLTAECSGPLGPVKGSSVTCTVRNGDGRTVQAKVVSEGSKSDGTVAFAIQVAG